jgi:ATP-dependent helicase/nuclease subunit A
MTRTIPDSVSRVQAEASDPRVSAFVAANAGSGKTHVLAQRVIRLLLDGVDPAKILCLTFTKAAAANMANRVFGWLADWVALDDAALDLRLQAIGVRRMDARRRARARRLFAAALETPGGLKVQTIHAFCTRLLQQFPFEANVAARFAVLDERATDELLNRTMLSVLVDAAAAPEGPLGRALASAIVAAADTTFREVVRETIGRRDAVTDWIAGGLDSAIAQLATTLGIAPEDTLEAVEKELVDGPLFPSPEWASVAALCNESTANDRKQCERLSEAAAASGSERVEAYLKVFLTDAGEQRKAVIAGTLAKIHPDLARRLADEQARVLGLIERRNAVVCRDRTAALLTIAAEAIDRYRAEKGRRGLLDYDDLIDKTLAMLACVDSAWVHYKLDLGLDHVLIDEAQDTSPQQWDIIRHLVAEFTAGAGARPGRRSIFAVGDEKQSIFSFQGAAPEKFSDMRRFFASAHEAVGLDFVRSTFTYSFRSGANVLGAVDEVFRAREIFAGVTSDEAGIPSHEALPNAAPGVVEIWPLVKPQERREIEAWDAPFDELTETSPQVRLAEQIARAARSSIARRDIVGSTGAPISAGDVLVLVRQRGPLFEAIIRALKEAGVPVAGADRLVLTEHIAVIDLMALADALLLPDDDLALAVALKSPLFGFDDELLFDLAWKRGGSLRAALAARAAEPAFAAAAALFERCAAAARRTPFSFFAWLLGPERGRAKILARLGHEAADALDEFLQLALDYERRETPSLQGFLAWLRAAPTMIKRDMEITRDEVRVMTVHGAKGLEAPVVILADTTTPPTGPRPPRLLAVPMTGAPGLVWAGSQKTDAAPVAAARTQALREAEHEHRRLLYVAMTRAADRLIVCGYEGKNGRRDGCWYDLVVQGLAGKEGLTEAPAAEGEEPVRVYRKTHAEPAVAPAEPPAPERRVEAPDWLIRPAPAEPARVALAPSRARGEAPGPAPRGAREDRAAALARGRLVHRLMQSLPDIAPAHREAAAQNFLARNAKDIAEAERERLIAETLGVLADPRFATLFAEGSRAEVPIVGRLRRDDGVPLMVSGQVDRLAVTAEAVLIADYKTNRPAPRALVEAPQEYVTQLALYRAVLAGLYGGRPVRAALVWTDGPDLMEIPAAALDAALDRVTSA